MFVGRREETRRIEELTDSGVRLITLWGPGGAGKTTLARRVRPGARWVDLAAARTKDDVVSVFATALGVEADEAAIRRAAETQGTALVADNVEQVSPEGRAVLAKIAEVAPLLVTSRDALGLPGEAAVEVAPLRADEAIALYTGRSGTADDEDARAIVARLDALPLAIELAAARAPLLGSAALRARLEKSFDVLRDRDRVARHATLHAAIAWSWELLDAPEREALVVCARFEAPFDAALAEAAVGGDALDALDSLRRRALLHVEHEHRLRLFESVREFARGVEGPSDASERHARAVLSRVEPLALGVRRGEAIDAELARRRPDLHVLVRSADLAPDLRGRALLALAALQSVTGPHDLPSAELAASGELALRLAIARGLSLRAAGRLDEAQAAAERALGLAPDDAHALRLAGMVARARGDTARARDLLERALASYRAVGEEAFAGLTLGELGAAQQSVARLAEGITVLVATRSVRAEGLLRSHLAVLTHRRGDPRAAVALHEAALAIHRSVGNRRLEGAELLHLGFVRHEIAELEAARACFEEARRTLAEAGALGLESFASVLRARLEVDAGDPIAARIALAEAERRAPTGWHRLVATHRVVRGHLALTEGDRAAAASHYDEALATSRDVEVGFEALTPAYRAFALGASPPEAPTFANPHLAHAWAILSGTATTAPPRAVASSSDVRRAIALAGRRALIVTSTAVILPDGRHVDLAKRKNIRFVLAALAARRAEGSTWTSPEDLIAAGWPGERMRPDAATKRLHTAVWTLRKLGLEGVLQSSENGYRLDPEIALELRPDPG